MSSESEANKALIRAHYQATTNDFDPAAIDRQVGEDFYDHAAGMRVGAEGVKQHLKALHAAFPDPAATIEEMVAEGPIAAVRATWRGTPAPPPGTQPGPVRAPGVLRVARGQN